MKNQWSMVLIFHMDYGSDRVSCWLNDLEERWRFISVVSFTYRSGDELNLIQLINLNWMKTISANISSVHFRSQYIFVSDKFLFWSVIRLICLINLLIPGKNNVWLHKTAINFKNVPYSINLWPINIVIL
jgi:hypothetical protein